MSAQRKAIRAALRAVVIAAIPSTPLAAARVISAWSQNLDPASLPAIGIATPAEERVPAAVDTDEQTFTAVVVVKRIVPGDDTPTIENVLDDDAELLIDAVESGLIQSGRDVALRSSAIDISGTGSPRVATLTLTFAVTTWRGRIRPA